MSLPVVDLHWVPLTSNKKMQNKLFVLRGVLIKTKLFQRRLLIVSGTQRNYKPRFFRIGKVSVFVISILNAKCIKMIIKGFIITAL